MKIRRILKISIGSLLLLADIWGIPYLMESNIPDHVELSLVAMFVIGLYVSIGIVLWGIIDP